MQSRQLLPSQGSACVCLIATGTRAPLSECVLSNLGMAAFRPCLLSPQLLLPPPAASSRAHTIPPVTAPPSFKYIPARQLTQPCKQSLHAVLSTSANSSHPQCCFTAHSAQLPSHQIAAPPPFLRNIHVGLPSHAAPVAAERFTTYGAPTSALSRAALTTLPPPSHSAPRASAVQRTLSARVW
jgi:hypothetical protein